MAHEDLLALSDFFAAAAPDVLRTIAASGHERTLIRGDVLFHEGDPADALYVVIRGRLAMAIENPIDHRETVVSLMEPGDLFGEMAMLDDGPRSTMARALEPSTVLAIPYDSVIAVFRAQPELLWGVTRLLAQRLRAMDETLADSVFLDVTGRTAKRLLNVAAVKEASGNISQIAEVCARVRPDFIVLSGDDAITLPAMAVGARGVISVASNQVPGPMSRLVEAAERNDFAAARDLHRQLYPLMTVNFVESNPIPVKASLAAMGLVQEIYRLPLVPPSPEAMKKITAVLQELHLLPGGAR